MPNLGPAANCLAAAYMGYINQEMAAAAKKIASITSSFTDPLNALINSNVNSLANDASQLASGNVMGKLQAMGTVFILNKVKNELTDILADAIKADPEIGERIEQIANISEAVYGIISLAMLTKKDAAYHAIELIIEELNELLDAKEASLKKIKAHIVQLNNVIQVATKNAEATATDIKAMLATVFTSLGLAETALSNLEVGLAGTPARFVDKYYTDAETRMKSIATLLAPETDTSILDITTALTSAAVGSDQVTSAQLKTATWSIIPLAYIVDCEMKAVEGATKKINRYIDRIEDCLPNYEAAIESKAMQNFRLKLVRNIRLKVTALKKEIEQAKNKQELSSISMKAIGWNARVSAINVALPKAKNKIKATTADNERREKMNQELILMLDELDTINGTYVSAALEDVTTMRVQANMLVNQAKNIMSKIGKDSVSNADMTAFQAGVNASMTGSSSAIEESLATVAKIKKALKIYKTGPTADSKLDEISNLLKLLGFDRAADLLKLGDFQAILDSTLDDASYIGLAIKCLRKVETNAGDSITLASIVFIREKLENQRINKITAAFDIIDSSKNAAILEVKNYMDDAQADIEKVKNIIAEIKGLAAKGGETIAALDEAAEGVGAALGGIMTSPGGSLNEYVSNLNVKGLPSGCPDMVNI